MAKASIQISPAAYVCIEEVELENRPEGRELRQALERLIRPRDENRLTISEFENFITDVDDHDERDMLESFAAEIRDNLNDFLGPDQEWGDFDVIFHRH